MPNFEIKITTTDDPRGVQSATEETLKLDDAMGKLLERAQRKEEYAAAKEKLAGMTDEEKSAALEAYRLAAAQEQANKQISKTGGVSQQSSSLLSGLKSSWMEINSAIGVAEKAWQVGKAIWDGTAGEFMSLADQTRDLSEAIGASSEQASALIAIADDVQVEAGTLQSAFEGAIKRGFTPSIQGLADLGDRFRSIQDPIAQTRFLMDTFGRSGADLRRLLELDRYELQKMANEAVATGQVLTEAQMKIADKNRQSADALGDAWGAWKMQMGQIFLPIANSVMDFTVKFNDYLVAEAGRTLGVKDANDQLAASLEKVSQAQGKVSRGTIHDSNYKGAGHVYNPGDEGYNLGLVYYTSGGRASGGPVEEGRMYTVNENKPWSGPEVFVAPADGIIYPSISSAAGAGGGQTIVEINLDYRPVIGLADRQEATEKLMPIIREGLRGLGIS